MPLMFKSLRLWIAVLVLSLTGLAAAALSNDSGSPSDTRAWPHSRAI